MSTNNPNLPPSSNSNHPSSSSSSQPTSSSKPSSSSSTHHHHLTPEERLQKEWRTITSNLLVCIQKAEKAGKETTKDNCKELDESVVNYLKMRMMWHRLMSHVQAKIQGKEEEMSALDEVTGVEMQLGKLIEECALMKQLAEMSKIRHFCTAAQLESAQGNFEEKVDKMNQITQKLVEKA